MAACRLMRALRSALIGAAVAIVLLVAGYFVMRGVLSARFAPKPETIAAASLQGMREQNRLSTFAARYVAVVTSSQSRLGVLSARKTLIMPGQVRYEVDLAKLTERDVRWDGASGTLTVTIPPVEVVGPDIDLDGIREYDSGGLLMKLSNTEDRLDQSNRQAAQAELLRQASSPTPMRIARDATRRAVERNFALPMRAAGLDAKVVVRFADERRSDEQMDRSTPLSEALGNR
jgi:hypothetical protein